MNYLRLSLIILLLTGIAFGQYREVTLTSGTKYSRSVLEKVEGNFLYGARVVKDTVHVDSTKEIRFKTLKKGSYWKEGLLVGFIVGFTVGYIGGTAGCSCPAGQFICFCGPELGVAIGTVLGIPSAILGALIGHTIKKV